MGAAAVIRILLLPLLLMASPALADTVTVLRVVDGDTIIIGEPCSRLLPGKPLRIRVAGVDTPESRKPPAKCAAEVVSGKAATAFVRELLRPGDQIGIEVLGPDKYACRVVASVTLPDGRDLASTLIAAGHARAYDGGRKGSWCPRRSNARAP